MNRIVMTVFGAAVVLGLPTVGFAGEDQPAPASAADSAQMSDAQIRDQLAQDGYTVQELKHEGDRISVIATDDRGTTSKLLVDAKTGRATPVADDDDDDDD